MEGQINMLQWQYMQSSYKCKSELKCTVKYNIESKTDSGKGMNVKNRWIEDISLGEIFLINVWQADVASTLENEAAATLGKVKTKMPTSTLT